jgi:hypothetical protein
MSIVWGHPAGVTRFKFIKNAERNTVESGMAQKKGPSAGGPR